MFLCFSPPHPPVRCRRMTSPIFPPGRRYWCLSPSSRSHQIDQCFSFAMICRTLSPFHPVALSYLPFFFLLYLSLSALCCYPQTSLPCFPYLSLYSPFFIPVPASFLPAFVNVFLNTFQFLPLASHYIGFLSLSLIFSLFLFSSK